MVEVMRSPELEERARESVRAVQDGDDRWFEDHTGEAGDILFYGTAPGEEWRGRDAVLSLTRGEAQRLMEEGGLSEDEPAFECFEAGDAGWIVAHGSFRLADGSTIPLRSVVVLVRDEGTWKRVFGAVHVLAPNELLAPGSPLVASAT